MKRVIRKLSGGVLMTTLLSAMLITNAQPVYAETNVQPPQTQTGHTALQCRQLTAGDMAGLRGAGWADWATRLIDLGCVAGSLSAALKLASPVVGAFCAGWAVGRYISG